MLASRRWLWFVAGLATLALVAWWSRHERNGVATTPAAVSIPAMAAPMPAAESAVRGGDPAAELRRLRRPGARPVGVVPLRSYDMPRGRAIDVVAALQPMAEAGDDEAAFYLFLKVEGCRYQLYRAGNDGNRPAPGIGDSVESQLAARTPAECHGLTADQYRDNVRWLEQAADAGITMAQLAYAGNAEAVVGNSSQMLANPERIIAYRRKAMHYLHQAAVNGSVEALMKLSDVYRYGVMAQRDPVRAYAYYYAKDLVSPSAYGRQHLQAYAAHLEPSQLATATQQGQQIYEACCR